MPGLSCGYEINRLLRGGAETGGAVGHVLRSVTINKHCRSAVAEPAGNTADDRPIPVQVVELLAEIDERQKRVQQLRAMEQRRVEAACRESLDAAWRAAGLTQGSEPR